MPLPGLPEIVVLFLIIIIYVMPVVLTYKKAGKTNRSRAGWLIAALVFGWIAFIVIELLPEKGMKQGA